MSLSGSARLLGAKSSVPDVLTLFSITDTKAPTAAAAASAPLAPTVSAALESVSKVVTICIETFSAFKAVSASVVSNGLNSKRSTPSKPKAVATSAGVKPPCSMSVVMGVTTPDPSGAVKVNPPAG